MRLSVDSDASHDQKVEGGLERADVSGWPGPSASACRVATSLASASAAAVSPRSAIRPAKFVNVRSVSSCSLPSRADCASATSAQSCSAAALSPYVDRPLLARQLQWGEIVHTDCGFGSRSCKLRDHLQLEQGPHPHPHSEEQLIASHSNS